MRFALVVAGLCAPLLVSGCGSSGGQAWCARYVGNGIASDCSYFTWEQCQATVSGAGGICEPNPRLVRAPPAFGQPL